MRILNHKAGKISTLTIVVILAGCLVFAFFMGWISISGDSGIAPTIPGAPTTPPQPTTPPTTTGWAGPLYLSTVDAVTGGAFTTSTVTVDQIAAVNGVFDFISGPQKGLTQAGNPQSAARIWNEGDEIIVMVDCTGNPTSGLDYYPVMYYMKLYDKGTIYEITSLSAFQLVSSNPYTYRVDTQYCDPLPQTIALYESSNVKYWNIGDLHLYPRQQADSFDQYLMYSATKLAGVTDAATWVDTAAEITANATLASTNERVTFEMVGALASVGWGHNFFVVSQQGQIQEYGSVIAMTTNMSGISTSKLLGEGWNVITTNTLYAEVGFYKILDSDDFGTSMMPAKGSKPHWTVDIPIECSAVSASTACLFRIWVNDCQNLANLATVGLSNSTITAYGFVTDYGVGASMANTGMSFASGVGDAEQLQVYLTTPA